MCECKGWGNWMIDHGAKRESITEQFFRNQETTEKEDSCTKVGDIISLYDKTVKVLSSSAPGSHDWLVCYFSCSLKCHITYTIFNSLSVDR